MHIYGAGYEEIDEFHVSWYQKKCYSLNPYTRELLVYDHPSNQNIEMFFKLISKIDTNHDLAQAKASLIKRQISS